MEQWMTYVQLPEIADAEDIKGRSLFFVGP
jgi:hypothetical protein